MKIIRIEPFLQTEAVKAIASVYQQSFGGEPWNEGYLCPVCEKVFPRPYDAGTCTACAKQSKAVLLVEYWPMSKIVSDFYCEMKKPESICVIAQISNQIIGFAWGYRLSANTEIDSHLDAPGLHKLLSGNFFYLDECAITPPHQGKGIGKMLVSNIFKEQQQKQVLLRTMNGSRMCNLIKNKGGEIIQHISRERVVMKLLTQ